MRTCSRGLAVLIAGLILLSSAAAARAQEAINHGSVAGRVSDSTGGVLVGQTVTARELNTNASASTNTDEQGRFRFPYLRPGQYELAIAAPGFATITRRLTVAAGSAFDIPITLSPAGTESITVTGETPALEAARSQIAATVVRQEVQALPLNGRQLLDLGLIVPGVSPPNVGGGTQLFAETSAVPGVGLSVASQRNFSNNFMVDGLSANDDAAGLSGISFSVDAIGQIQIVTSGGQAELGRALGGHINLATRSGTNTWHAEGASFFRDDALNARNALSGAKLPMRQSQFSGSVGGPLSRDRTFLFANVEYRDLNQSGLTTISPDTVSAINERLAAVGYQGSPVTTGVYANPVDTLHALAKVDRHLNSGGQLSARYSAYRATSRNARGAGGISAPSASASLDNLDQTAAGSAVRLLSPSTVLEWRGQIARGELDARPSDPAGPAVSIAGVASFGRLSTSPTGRRGTLVQSVANLLHQSGAHAIRAGLDVLHNDVTIDFPRAARGAYAFSSLSNFLAGVYNNNGFTQTFGDTRVGLSNPNIGVFVQDEWRAGPQVTINAGVRYDLQFLETIGVDRDNISPRLGVAWSPDGSRRTVMRLSGGRFFDRVPLRALANALLSAGNTTDLSALRQINVSLSPAQAGAPVFPATLSAIVPTSTLVNFTTIDRDLQNAHSDQGAVEIEHQLGQATTVSVGYQRLEGHGLLMQINQNVPTCPASGNNNGCRPNPAYANNNQYSSAGSSQYDGLHLSLQQRASRWGHYRVSYTLSKSMNDVGEFFFSSPYDPADLSKDRGRSDDDQRHRLTVSGALTLPFDAPASWWQAALRNLQISAFVQFYSGSPFNITTGTTTIQGTPARPMIDGVVIPRNSGEGEAFSSTSLRLSKSVRLRGRASVEFLVEGFNIFNRRNALARISVFGPADYPSSPAPDFGRITAVGEPRSVQLGIRVRY